MNQKNLNYRDLYLPSTVETIIWSPRLINWGTRISNPVAVQAFFCNKLTVFPRTACSAWSIITGTDSGKLIPKIFP